MLKNNTLKLLMLGFVVNLFTQGLPINKAHAYMIVSILSFDKTTKQDKDFDKAACAFLFPICLPYLILGTSSANASGSLSAIDQTWLSDNGYTENEQLQIMKEIHALQSQGLAIQFDKNDTLDSVTKALRAIYPQISELTISVIESYLGLSAT